MGGGGGLSKIIPLAATALGAYFLGPAIGGMMAGEGAAATAAQLATGAAIGGAVGGTAGSMLSGPPEVPNVERPQIAAPNALPVYGSGAGAEAARASTISSQMARRGRAQSILTSGGLDNSGTKLGA